MLRVPLREGPRLHHRRAARVTVAACALALLAAACSDEDREGIADRARDVREGAEDLAGAASARATAETLRAALEARDLDEGETPRDVAILEDAAADLPGDPAITGIADRDGDDRDDDGRVEVRVGDQRACLTVAVRGGDVDVTGGACG